MKQTNEKLEKKNGKRGKRTWKTIWPWNLNV